MHEELPHLPLPLLLLQPILHHLLPVLLHVLIDHHIPSPEVVRLEPLVLQSLVDTVYRIDLRQTRHLVFGDEARGRPLNGFVIKFAGLSTRFDGAVFEVVLLASDQFCLETGA